MKEENEEYLTESDEIGDSDMSAENVEVEEVEEKALEEDPEVPKTNKKILNTQELLNLMTIMVREVRQKKIWLVRRLIKKIKLLKKKKGTEVQKRKNADHITALQQEVFYSRILDISKTAKFLLLNTQKDLNKILSYSYNDTKPAVRFQAKLGLIFDSIKKKVESFHEAYPNWREFLPILFHENRQKRRSKLIKMGMFVNKSRAKNEQTRERSSLTDEGKKINESNSIVDSFNSWNVTGESNFDDEASVKLEKVKKELDDKEKIKKLENMNKKSATPATENAVKDSKPLKEMKSENASKKRKISDSEESIPTLVPIDLKPSKVAKTDVEVASPPPLRIGSVFHDGRQSRIFKLEQIQSSRIQPDQTEDKNPKKKFEKKPSTSRHNNFDPEKFNLKFEKKPGFNNKNNFDSEKTSKFSKHSTFTEKSKFNKNKNSGNMKKLNNDKPILHPSWEAKKKLSGITEFKGTKIQFD